MRTIRLCLSALGCAALLVTAAGSAVAVPDDRPGLRLPLVGNEFTLPLRVEGLTLHQPGKDSVYDTKGTWKVAVEANPDSPFDSVLLKTDGFTLAGRARDGGAVTITQNGGTEKSLLRMVQALPPRYEQVMLVGFTLSVEQPGGASPLTLTTREPAKLVGSLTRFPPAGDPYRLAKAVELVVPGNPGTTVATIDKLPVVVGDL